MTKNEKLILKCDITNLSVGYTKVKITPNVYSRLVTVAGMTGKTLQDAANELLAYALSNVLIQQPDGSIINLNSGRNE